MKDQQADIVRLNHFIRDFSVSSVYCYSKTQKKKKKISIWTKCYWVTWLFLFIHLS